MLLTLCRRTVRLGLVPALLVGAAVPADSALAKGEPAAVKSAQASVVQVETPRQRGSAFAVTSDGLFVTASATVARTQDITIIYKGDRYAATRLESSAPRGIALLRTERPVGEKALAIQEGDPKTGSRLWVLAVNKSGNPVVRRATLERVNPVGSMETARATTVAGESGGPLVTSQGKVVGVSAPPRPDEKSSGLVSYRLAKLPVETDGVRADDGSGFPAVPVAIGLGVLLLLANLGVRWMRNRSLTTESPVPAMPGGPPPSTPVPAPVGGMDDIEVSLKPR